MTRFPLTAALLLAACATATNVHAETRAWNVDRFEAVSLYGSYDTSVQAGGREWKVVAEGDRQALDRLAVGVHESVLKIGPVRHHRGGWQGWGDSGDLRVTVIAPRVVALRIAGSGDVRMNRATGDLFKCSVAGSGSVKIDRVDVGELKLTLAGSGDFAARGRCRQLTASVAGSGEARLEDVRCATATINVAGSGAVAARASNTAQISAIGSGAVRVYGGPRCTVTRTGSAQVYCEGGSLLSGLYEPPQPPEPPAPPMPPRPPRPHHD